MKVLEKFMKYKWDIHDSSQIVHEHSVHDSSWIGIVHEWWTFQELSVHESSWEVLEIQMRHSWKFMKVQEHKVSGTAMKSSWNI